jgi:hypothetical protein
MTTKDIIFIIIVLTAYACHNPEWSPLIMDF